MKLCSLLLLAYGNYINAALSIDQHMQGPGLALVDFGSWQKMFRLCCRWQTPEGYTWQRCQMWRSLCLSLCCPWGQRKLLSFVAWQWCLQAWCYISSGVLAAVRSIMLCISRLYRKQMCLSLPTWVWSSIYLNLFTGHKEAQQLCGLQKEQAQHWSCCTPDRLHRQCQILGHCERLHLNAAAPRHAWMFFSVMYRKTKQMNSQQSWRRRFSLLTELSSSDVFCMCSLLLKLYHIIRSGITSPDL